MLHYRRATSSTARPARRRLVAFIAGAAAVMIMIVCGLALSVLDLAHTHSDAISPRTTTTTPERVAGVSAAVARARDALAASPMPDTGVADLISTRDPGAPIRLPQARGADPLAVAEGFPHTSAGAVAQLAAIDVAALESGSVPRVRAIIRAWAAPGGPTTASWTGVQVMAGLLQDAGVSAAGAPDLRIVVTPAMGLIKGTIGPDFLVACIDSTIDVSLGWTWHAVVVDCQRMLWQSSRWVIGPGNEPAPPPQVWPDTDAAIEAGYHDLTP